MADASLYYRTAGGALASRTVTGDHAEAPPLPEGATALTEAEYADALADVQEQRQAHTQQLTQETEANQQADYEALRALGVPEATTRRLTGYMGPDSGA
jgi:flagellar biosynthesis/type III secretory pathway protein FliH